ncbi:hypothetical protein BHE74_00059100 [Ensete ventricosum]|nr:hypothetical protein BHE74_00059100 [Ensete ventricosum]
MCELRKPNPSKDKSTMINVKSQMFLRHVSRENLTRGKINPLWWMYKAKCAQDI